jgi:ribosomal protein L16/L10AE
MNLKSLQTLKSKTALKKKNLLHRLSYKNSKINYNLNFVTVKKSKMIFLQSMQNGYLFDHQLISFFKFIQKHKILKKKLYVRSYPFLPLTKKPLEVRMGKGKGKINNYCKPVYKGNIIMEIRFNSKKIKKNSSFFLFCKSILLKVKKKFNFKSKIINQDF